MGTSPKLQVWERLARRHPSALLLAAQLISLLIYPLIGAGHTGRLLFGAISLVVIPMAMWVISHSPSITRIGWFLAVPAMLLTVVGLLADVQWLLTWSALLEAGVYFYAALGLTSYMLHDANVTADDLFAAGATFTLLAWGFAYLYFVCQSWYPGSFTGFEPERPRRWLELLFYSFTNLSATGLGDVLPVSAHARVLTMLEQFAGVGYIAAVVSRLIGLTTVRERR